MNPRSEYSDRLAHRRSRAAGLAQREHSIGNLRLLVVVAAIVLAVLVFGYHVLAPGWLGVPAIAFLAFVLHLCFFSTC
jgi:hypothetical protein